MTLHSSMKDAATRPLRISDFFVKLCGDPGTAELLLGAASNDVADLRQHRINIGR
jgi:hypothetical protein